MKKIICFFLLLFFIERMGFTQNELNQYLATHRYPISLDKGFDQETAELLQRKLENYKVLLQAEGGSHYQEFYFRLPYTWLTFLNTRFNTTHFFVEGGHSAAMLLNRYLQTGDTSYLFKKNNPGWEMLYKYNQTVPEKQRISYVGVDFESRIVYAKALQTILPAMAPPENIKPVIDLIRNAVPARFDCDSVIALNKELKKYITKYKSSFASYFKDNYSDLEKIVFNNATCKDVTGERNGNMANRFLLFSQSLQDKILYGEFGAAHTRLITRNLASILNSSPEFKNNICVVNLYCYNCSTLEEGISSNWPLSKIDKDIVQYFLPYCSSDFTLFDLSGDESFIKQYKAYGQFLLIAKDQHPHTL